MSNTDYTIKELAEKLDVDRSRVQAMVSNKSQCKFMKAYKKGGSWFIPRPFKDPRQLQYKVGKNAK